MPSSDDEELERRREVLEVEQRQVVVVAVLEDQREDARLRLVEVQDLPEQERSERVDRRPHLRPELARQRQELDRMTRRLELQAQRRHALDDLRVRRVAGCGQAGQVALDVRDEDRDAGLRELPGHQLERLGLAGAGGPRDEPVAVEHREGDLDVDVVEQLAVAKGAAQHDTRLGQRVTGRHGIAECLVHQSLRRRANDGRAGKAKRIIGLLPLAGPSHGHGR